MEKYDVTIRDYIGDFIGHQILEITQHDPEEWEETGEMFVNLHFDDGRTLQFIVGEEGFHILTPDGEDDSQVG